MLSDKVQASLNTRNVLTCTSAIKIGRGPIDIRASVLKPAVEDIVKAFRYVVMQYGLPNLSTPRPAPLTNDFVMRALVMLRAIYQYEVRTAPNLAVAVKGGQYDGEKVRAPGREELCGKNGGLIVDTYKALGIDALGFEASCGGTVGVGQSAHLLSEAGLILERYETQISNLDPVGDQDLVVAYKKAKTPYALTDVGRIFCFWLFGDKIAIARSNGINNNGYSGIKAVASFKGVNYSGWLNFLELDFPSSDNSDTISSTQVSTTNHNTNKVDVISNDEDDSEDETGSDKSAEDVADEISDTLLKIADTYKVELEAEE